MEGLHSIDVERQQLQGHNALVAHVCVAIARMLLSICAVAKYLGASSSISSSLPAAISAI
jgi:hypothetical protein